MKEPGGVNDTQKAASCTQMQTLCPEDNPEPSVQRKTKMKIIV